MVCVIVYVAGYALFACDLIWGEMGKEMVELWGGFATLRGNSIPNLSMSGWSFEAISAC